MHKVSIIEPQDPKWLDVLQKSENYDFYHTPFYHTIELIKGQRPVLFLVEVQDDFIAMPFIIRDIEGTSYKDVTSAYGYAGPVSSVPMDHIFEEVVQAFQEELKRFFESKQIVTAFSRLHPLFDSGTIFENFGIVKPINKTVTIDLRLSLEDQRRQYRKSNKSEINQLRKKKGYSVRLAVSESDIETFVDIYQETMKRVNATENYFFNLEYFKALLSSTEWDAKLLLAMQGDEITAGAIFTFTNNVVQYHLAGTRGEYAKDTPMKLLIDEARMLGAEAKKHYLHLGGGVGGSDTDSLFRFKSGFSNRNDQFSIWQYVCNEAAYEELNATHAKNTESDFFPKYRG